MSRGQRMLDMAREKLQQAIVIPSSNETVVPIENLDVIFSFELDPTAMGPDIYIPSASNNSNENTIMVTDLNFENISKQNELEMESKAYEDDPDYVRDMTDNSNSSEEQLHITDADNDENNNLFVPESVETEETDETGQSGVNSVRRQRKSKSCNWKRNKNKILRMNGKEYVGFCKIDNKYQQQKIRSPRVQGISCKSNKCLKSKNRFCHTFTPEIRQAIFNNFWDKCNWDQRKIFIASNVICRPASRMTVETSSRRSKTYDYFMHNGTDRVQVCRNMFLQSLAIGYKTVHAWIESSRHGLHQETYHSNKARKSITRGANSSQKECLHSFFEELPKLPSHYARANSSKLFLEPIYSSIRDVFKQYQIFCASKNTLPLRITLFTETFHEKNLSIFQKKKDECNVCASFRNGNLAEDEYNKHIINKNRARDEKARDKELAISGNIFAVCMDLQAVKLAPHVNANAFYYKTKLCCHNFTFYNLATKDVKCYWFSEDQCNNLCASTFTSCIIDYLSNNLSNEEKKTVVIYSDGCGYENRNNVLANALLNFSMQNDIKIIQKYLEPGHTQMECDSIHSKIEHQLKNREIHLPSNYLVFTKAARINPKPYEVENLRYTFFKNYSLPEHLRYSSIRPGRRAHDPVVTDIKALRYFESKIKYKLCFDHEWSDLPGRFKKIDFISNYPPLFSTTCKIKKSKYDHLQDLKSVIPSDCHAFYDNLEFAD